MTTQSENISELVAALCKAQGVIESAVKGKKNPFFKSTYADLPAVWDACREPLTKNGLAIIQVVEGDHENSFLVTTLGHTSGQWIKSRIPLLMTKKDIQGLGSAMTYARRYSLMALVGVCQEDEDDDGNIAAGHAKTKPVDMTDAEIQEYLKTWGKDKEKFAGFMQEIMKSKKWNYTQVVEQFETDRKYTDEAFRNWLKKKETAAA